MKGVLYAFIKSFFMFTLAANSNVVYSQNRHNFSNSIQCRENLDNLRKDLIRILRKTPAMPPLAQLYAPLRRILNEQEYNYRNGNFKKCIHESEKALKISSMYR